MEYAIRYLSHAAEYPKDDNSLRASTHQANDNNIICNCSTINKMLTCYTSWMLHLQLNLTCMFKMCSQSAGIQCITVSS